MLKKLYLLPLLVLAAIGLRTVTDRLLSAHATGNPPSPAADAAVTEEPASAASAGNDNTRLTPAPPHERPVLVAERTEIDAGPVSRGETQHYEFVLKNTGEGPLEVRAKATCNCTVARYDRTIAPGAQGNIEVELKTGNLRGKVRKTIQVSSNDPQRAEMELVVTATVRSVVEVRPSDTPLLSLKDSGPTDQRFTLNVLDSEPVEVRGVTCSVAYAAATLEPLPAQNDRGQDYQLTLTVGKEAPLGRSDLIVSVQTTSQREPLVRIKVRCEKGILATPAKVSFGAARANPGAPVERVVMLVKRDGSFHIRKLESSDPNLEVREQALRDGSQYRLTVSYQGGWSPGMVQSKIRVETDDPEQPTIEIPVTAIAKADSSVSR